jgi:hypothetical protein
MKPVQDRRQADGPSVAIAMAIAAAAAQCRPGGANGVR